jgi:hypothetical protein
MNISRTVPKLGPETEDEIRRYEDAARRRENRKLEHKRRTAVKTTQPPGRFSRETLVGAPFNAFFWLEWEAQFRVVTQFPGG